MKQSKFKRTVGSTSDAGAIRQMNQDLDRALAKFQVANELHLDHCVLILSLQAGTIVDIANQLEQDGVLRLACLSRFRGSADDFICQLNGTSSRRLCLAFTKPDTTLDSATSQVRLAASQGLKKLPWQISGLG